MKQLKKDAANNHRKPMCGGGDQTHAYKTWGSSGPETFLVLGGPGGLRGAPGASCLDVFRGSASLHVSACCLLMSPCVHDLSMCLRGSRCVSEGLDVSPCFHDVFDGSPCFPGVFEVFPWGHDVFDVSPRVSIGLHVSMMFSMCLRGSRSVSMFP